MARCLWGAAYMSIFQCGTASLGLRSEQPHCHDLKEQINMAANQYMHFVLETDLPFILIDNQIRWWNEHSARGDCLVVFAKTPLAEMLQQLVIQ